jgi:hypothetical protein
MDASASDAAVHQQRGLCPDGAAEPEHSHVQHFEAPDACHSARCTGERAKILTAWCM